MRNRSGLKDYVPPSSEVSENSITALNKEIPPVINNTELNITKEKVNVNSAKVNRIIKNFKILRYFKLDYNEDEYIKNKEYRDVLMMDVGNENYMKWYLYHKDLDEEIIKEKIEKQVEMEDEKE
jgi:hypothetical protein